LLSPGYRSAEAEHIAEYAIEMATAIVALRRRLVRGGWDAIIRHRYSAARPSEFVVGAETDDMRDRAVMS
jgi:hypothetical protein